MEFCPTRVSASVRQTQETSTYTFVSLHAQVNHSRQLLALPALEILRIAVLVAKLLDDRLDARVVPVLTTEEESDE